MKAWTMALMLDISEPASRLTTTAAMIQATMTHRQTIENKKQPGERIMIIMKKDVVLLLGAKTWVGRSEIF